MSAARELAVHMSPGEKQGEQYSLAKILGIWAFATAPMSVLGWIVLPLLAPEIGADPLGAGVARPFWRLTDIPSSPAWVVAHVRAAWHHRREA